MSNFRQNKAHQTVQAMGCADNPLVKGLSNGTKHRCECGAILNPFNDGVNHLIAKNYRKLQFDNQKQPNRWGWMGHNGGSENQGSAPRLYRGLFVPPIAAACLRTRIASGLPSTGVCVRSNPHTVLDGQSTPTFYTVVLNSENQGGYHA